MQFKYINLFFKLVYIFLFFLVVMINIDLAESATYYMATNGDDNNDGSINNPWRHLTPSSRKLQPGDTLYIRGGTYFGEGGGSSWQSPFGTPGAPITLAAYPGETPIFDGGWSLAELFAFGWRYDMKWMIIDGLTITHYNSSSGDGAINLGQTAENIIIQNCTFIDNGVHITQDHHIYFSGPAQYVTIRNNKFINPAAASIHFYHSPQAKHIYIYNNIMTGGHWGIIIAQGAEDVQIYNNVIYNNDINVHLYDNTLVNIVLKNNIIFHGSNGTNMLVNGSSAELTEDYNLFFPDWSGKGPHSISANPMFEDISTGDLRLQYNSPAIDAGTDISLVTNDYFGNLRPQGLATDIGIYEYSGVSSPPYTPPAYQCSDNIDNDNDGLIDYPNDPGCSSTVDNDEYNAPAFQAPAGAIEAESGTITAPMQSIADVDASGGSFIQTSSLESGTASYTFNIDTSGIYKIIARIYAVGPSNDSFYVQIDDGSEFIWHLNPTATPNEFNIWREDDINNQGAGTFDNPQYDPYTISLTEGTHSITFRGRETSSRLDYFYLVKIKDIDTIPPAPPVIMNVK